MRQRDASTHGKLLYACVWHIFQNPDDGAQEYRNLCTRYSTYYCGTIRIGMVGIKVLFLLWRRKLILPNAVVVVAHSRLGEQTLWSRQEQESGGSGGCCCCCCCISFICARANAIKTRHTRCVELRLRALELKFPVPVDSWPSKPLE
jgi:hypothetical protein